MRDRATFEYSTFDIPNPLRWEEARRVEQFNDWYIHWDKHSTLKQRSGSTNVKCKELVRSLDDIDVFHTLTFPNNSQRDPLQSFLQLHHLTEAYTTRQGIVLTKKRALYLVGNASVHYSCITVQGGCHHETPGVHLSITGRTERSVREAREHLGIKESNLSFSNWLQNLCSQDSEVSSPSKEEVK